MTESISVISRTQIVEVNPTTGAVAVVNAGPAGAGLPGLAGDDGESIDFLGTWAAGIGYLPLDAVHYKGSLYVCKVAHTSSTGNNPQINSTNWGISAQGFNWTGNYSSGTTYQVYDLVLYAGSIWASTANNNLNHQPNIAGSTWWSVIARGWNWVGAWVSGTVYRVADITKYNGSTYRCNADITSAPGTTTAPDVNASWDLIAQKGDTGAAGSAGAAGAAGANGINPLLGYSEARPGTNTTFPPAGYAANTWYDSGCQVTFTTGATTTKVKVTLSVYTNANAASSTTATVLWGLRTTANVLVTNSDHRAAGAASSTAAYAGKITSVFVLDVTVNTTYTWKWSVQVNTVATWNHTAGVQFPATMVVEALN